jgi:hypothetical protein
VAKEKKPRAPKPPASVEKLVSHALKTAATKPKANWTGTTGAALFNTKEANHGAAIAECTNPAAPLLKQVGKVGVLTPAGFEKVAAELPDEVVPLAKAMAAGMTAIERVSFLQGVISRTPAAAAELTPLLDEAAAAKKAELEAATAAKVKQAAAAAVNQAALERALELSKQDLQNEIDAVKRQWEALGQKLSDLPAHKPALALVPESKVEAQPKPVAPIPEPRTAGDKDFRRDSADQFAAAWRAAWDAKKAEALEYLESAMWNISGLQLRGEVGARTTFDGRYHECGTPVFTGDAVNVVRPGWVLDEGDGHDYVALKAVVEKA